MIILDISNGYRNVLLAETIPGKESGCVIRDFLQRVMYGRYGSDQLSFFLLGVYVLLYFIKLLRPAARPVLCGHCPAVVGLLPYPLPQL